MEWEIKNIDLGTIKQKAGQEIIFKVKEGEEIKRISNLDSSCGCSTPRWDEKNKQLKVSYIPGAVPIHLIKEGKKSYKSSKMIYVKYEDGTSDVLNFTAKVIK